MTLFTPPPQTTLHYRIVTPMFLGGEDQKADATQFRNASYKGALRFWWRALNWGGTMRDSGNDQEAALKRLHHIEGELLGLASDGKDSRQSRVQIRSELQGAVLRQPGMALQEVAYLLGQGLYHFRDGVTRSYLEGGALTIHLRYKPGTPEEDIQSVERAAIALGLFGGLGSRARSGLGSLALQKLERGGQEPQEFTSVDSIRAFIQELDFSAPADAPLSALTKATRVDISTTKDNALSALAAINDELQLYRGYGRHNPRTGHHEVNGKKARQNFRSDHDHVLAATQGEQLVNLPRRAVFGLPHNYFFSSTRSKMDITTEGEGRRASPLLVHVHPLQDGKFIAVQTLLQATFLPRGMRVEAKGRETAAIPNAAVDYAVITDYLDGDGFANKQTLRAAQHD